ncbi:MAG TPA: aldehyde dehydrogenase family protein [Acidimicrobiia bacterium]|nr:aldehyde dehydrogenase family protein [Acidimicrobiia bacterium]
MTTPKITYATMSSDNEELHSAYDAALERVQSRLGEDHPYFVDGEERTSGEWFEERSPIDRDVVVGRFAQATVGDIDDAVAAAGAFNDEWESTPWQQRRDLMLGAAELMEGQLFDLAALMAHEVGKNRLEALGDVAETVEFFRYYGGQMTEHDGFETPLSSLSAAEHNVSVLRPYGTWAVISPFNFPLALASGPTIGALLTGNTVVLKPSNQGALMAIEFYRLMREAGLPPSAFHVVTGGDEVGDALAHHDGVDGLTFTGSYDVGMYLYRTVREKRPKPVIAEMGGKNPAIVTATADLDAAVEGVVRGAFGFSGQKCSATSRVYVERPVYDEFVDRLTARAKELKVGDPLERDAFTGPVIDEEAVERFEKAIEEVTARGGRVLHGGERLTDDGLTRGNYLAPTVVAVPEDSYVWSQELFVPLVAVGAVESLDEGLDKANDTPFGLTAGLFAGTNEEIQRFFDRIEAGVTYVNRAAGATTGAWPDIQSFGGWKGSGTSGAGGGGPWYLRNYLREQSRTVVR